MESIYSRYRTGNASFERTLNLLHDLLRVRLCDGFRKINVDGCNSGGKSTILFTVFDTAGEYRMIFYTSKNLRQYRPIEEKDENMDKFQNEIRLMEELILSFRSGVLGGYIN